MKSSEDFTPAHRYPLHECLINPEWREAGHARVLVSRIKPNGRIAFGVFLVDLYCLGVKDVMVDENALESQYEKFLKPMTYFDGMPVPCDVNCGHTIIYGSIAYARTLGFVPHTDFEKCKYLLMPEPEITVDATVKFGKDGKPLYIQGPDDDADHILATLKKTVGEGNFGFVAGEDMSVGDDDIDEMFQALMSMGKKK